MTAPRTVVVGLDGAHFELIDRWIDEGRLPNVERVIGEGVSGDLESVLPPVTSPNWRAYATGKNPGKLGIFWWENVDTDARRVYYPTARKGLEPAYWELLGMADGERAGVLGVPLTYPPAPLDGFLVAGAPDGEDDGYTYPPDLAARLDSEFDYRVTKDLRLADDRDAAAEEILELIDSRFTVGRHLAEEYDVTFLQVTTFYLNSLHHFLWDHEYTRRGWEIVDEHLGAILDDDVNVVLMSDHGATEIRTVFHVNTWLEREGYLAVEEGVASTVHRLGINKDRLLRLATRLGVQQQARRLAPEWILRYLPDESGELNRKRKADHVDWGATRALASGQGPVYLTLDPGDPEYETVRTELRDRLAGLTDPAGRPVATAVHRGEDVYEGPYLDEAPDLVIEQAPGVHVPGTVGRDEVFTEPTADGWRAENKRSGLFAARGPAFDEGEVADLSILDLAPTLLHLHDRPVPPAMDGEVRTDVFAPGSDPAGRDVHTRPLDDQKRELDRIRRVARRADL